MSAYSDYKVGALSYEEYVRECVRENLRDRFYYEYYEIADEDLIYFEDENEDEE